MRHPTRRAYSIALAAILLLGVTLRTIEYAALGSLWLDELFIALNVTTREWGQLLKPLAYHQVAPIGFLIAVKLGTEVLGVNEAGLRLFPYICSLASLILFWRISMRFLSPLARLGAVAIFAMSPAMLWYARNVKQYSGDVAVVLLLVIMALRFREGRDDIRRAVLGGVLGGAAILCSQPAVLVGGVLIAVLFVQRRGSSQSMLPLACLALGWAIGALTVTVTSLILSPVATREFMRAGWDSRGFLPLGPEALVWLPHRLSLLPGLFVGQFMADTILEGIIAGAFAVLVVIGLPYLFRRQAGMTALLSAPVLAAILLSAARILPLSWRVSIYLAPVLLIMSMAGTDQLRAWLPRNWRMLASAAVLGLVMVPAAVLVLFIDVPNRREEARPVLEELRSRWIQGDAIYVLPPGRRAMEFYGRRLGFRNWQTSPGPGGLRSPLRELDSFRGRSRVWIFYTHAVPCRQRLIRSYLETIGREVDRIEDPYGNKGKSEAAAYLYDLSDPQRLAQSNAETYPVPKHISEDCGYPREGLWTKAKNRLGSLLEAVSG